MQAGKLKHRIVIDEPLTTQNEINEEVVHWTPLAGNFWASIEPLTGRETLQAAQIGAGMDTRIRVRWSPVLDQITAKWRIRHGQTIYNIVSVAHIKFAQREIEIMTHSGRNSG